MYRKVRNTSKPFGERATALNKLRLNLRLNLRSQAIVVVCVSALISCVCYLILSNVGTYLLDQCLSEQVHVEQRNKEMLQSLQEYVSQQDLQVEDTNDIDVWLDSQRGGYLMMGIYQNDQLIYDSTAYRLGTGYFNKTYSESNTDGFTTQTIAFADGDAQVLLYGYYDSAYYTLANGLNQMRMALAENMEKEAEAKRANYELIAAVSHDLRTPMTSLRLYLDLLREGRYDTEQEMHQYLDKSREKVVQIKQLSDQLFDRFYMSKKSSVQLEPPVKAQFVLEDYLSNLVGFLEVNGYHIQAQLDWPEAYIAVSMEYMGRIFDNIGSNILKYADPEQPVLLTVSGSKRQLVIRFENEILLQSKNPESTEVGVRNICLMMEKMHGLCQVRKTKGRYCIQLAFAAVRE